MASALARAYNGNLRAEPSVGSRDNDPGGHWGLSFPEADDILENEWFIFSPRVSVVFAISSLRKYE